MGSIVAAGLAGVVIVGSALGPGDGRDSHFDSLTANGAPVSRGGLRDVRRGFSGVWVRTAPAPNGLSGGSRSRSAPGRLDCRPAGRRRICGRTADPGRVRGRSREAGARDRAAGRSRRRCARAVPRRTGRLVVRLQHRAVRRRLAATPGPASPAGGPDPRSIALVAFAGAGGPRTRCSWPSLGSPCAGLGARRPRRRAAARLGARRTGSRRRSRAARLGAGRSNARPRRKLGRTGRCCAGRRPPSPRPP